MGNSVPDALDFGPIDKTFGRAPRLISTEVADDCLLSRGNNDINGTASLLVRNYWWDRWQSRRVDDKRSQTVIRRDQRVHIVITRHSAQFDAIIQSIWTNCSASNRFTISNLLPYYGPISLYRQRTNFHQLDRLLYSNAKLWDRENKLAQRL